MNKLILGFFGVLCVASLARGYYNYGMMPYPATGGGGWGATGGWGGSGGFGNGGFMEFFFMRKFHFVKMCMHLIYYA